MSSPLSFIVCWMLSEKHLQKITGYLPTRAWERASTELWWAPSVLCVWLWLSLWFLKHAQPGICNFSVNQGRVSSCCKEANSWRSDNSCYMSSAQTRGDPEHSAVLKPLKSQKWLHHSGVNKRLSLHLHSRTPSSSTASRLLGDKDVVNLLPTSVPSTWNLCTWCHAPIILAVASLSHNSEARTEGSLQPTLRLVVRQHGQEFGWNYFCTEWHLDYLLLVGALSGPIPPLLSI